MAISEDVYYEGGPHVGDLIFNIALAFTIICIPLTVGAIVRSLWLRYRITSRRISITGGWMGRDRTDHDLFRDCQSCHRSARAWAMGRHGDYAQRRQPD